MPWQHKGSTGAAMAAESTPPPFKRRGRLPSLLLRCVVVHNPPTDDVRLPDRVRQVPVHRTARLGHLDQPRVGSPGVTTAITPAYVDRFRPAVGVGPLWHIRHRLS